MSNQVKKFVEEICELLNINVPKIVEDKSTLQAAYCMGKNENELYLNSLEEPTADLLFSIAYALRHKWQYERKKDVYLKGYLPIAECRNAEEYNNQLSEIDANAFGAIIMANYFGLEPLFSSLSERTKQRIKERIKDIVDNWWVEQSD